jgi:hypothetical protein
MEIAHPLLMVLALQPRSNPGVSRPRPWSRRAPGPPLRRHFVTPKVAQVPMTLGGAAAARVRFIVWCLECRYQAEPDPAEMTRRYGPETYVKSFRIDLAFSKFTNAEQDTSINFASSKSMLD